MSDSRGIEMCRRHERMKSERSIWDAHYNEIAERIWPDRAMFIQKDRTPGEKRTEKIFDSTAALALTRFGAAMESMLTPRTSKWHRLRIHDDKLNSQPAVARWLDEVTNILFRVRYGSTANFASQIHESYMGIGCFGTGGIFINDMLGVGIRYKSIDLCNTYIAENYQGVIDTVHREFVYTARQAVQQFDPAKLPGKILTAADKRPDDIFRFLHCVAPNEEQVQGRRDYKGMAFASYYVALDDKVIVEEGGYRTMPYALGRYITTPGEVYGRGPAMMALPGVKMLNEMKKTVLRAGHLAVDPPWLLQEDGALQAFSMRPGALNYGGVNEQGQQTAHPATTGTRVDIGLELMQAEQTTINDFFLVSLFQILVDAPNMTATEAMLRAQEKGALLAPTMGRQQSELLGPCIDREIDILFHAGMLPPMPPELIEAGGDFDVEYVSPLNRAQQAEDGVAILRTFEGIAPLAQLDPRVLKAYDLVEAAKELGRINGIPAKIIRSDEEIAAIEDAEAQQAQLQRILDAAPVIADTAHTMAQTQQLAGQGTPPTVATVQ